MAGEGNLLKTVEILSLVAGLLTVAAPILQVGRTARTRNVEGLSWLTYTLLVIANILAALLGVQYGIQVMILLNILNTACYAIILGFISATRLAALVGGITVSVGLLAVLAPSVAARLLTPDWAEPVAFGYGLIAVATLLPQVCLTRRSRDVEALSLSFCICLSVGMIIWTFFAVLIKNWSLIFFNFIITLAAVELMRLRILYGKEDGSPATAG